MPWGVAVAAGISATAGTINGAQASSAAKKAAAPLTQAQNTLYGDAESIASTPYTPYTGQQVADLSSNQVSAVQQANADSAPGNQASAYLTDAGDEAADIAGNNWNSTTAKNYMNPYTQNVTDLALNQENQSYANTQNTAGLTAASSGAFGGDRAALTQATNTVGHNYNQGEIEAQGQAAAYTNAQQLWSADNARMSSAANAYSAAGNDITNMNSQDINNLLSTGGAQQAVAQMKLTTGYNNYLDQRNWATNQLAPLESAAGRTPTLAATSPTNYASSLVGAGSALAGYFGSNSANNQSTASETASLNNTSAADTASEAGNYFGLDTNSSEGAGSNVNVAPSQGGIIGEDTAGDFG